MTRNWARRLHIVDHSHNDIVGFYLAAVTVFYGITLGLLAIGTWTTYAEVQNKIDHEATVLGGLYRDISAYPEPMRTIMRNDLRSYTRQVILAVEAYSPVSTASLKRCPGRYGSSSSWARWSASR